MNCRIGRASRVTEHADDDSPRVVVFLAGAEAASRRSAAAIHWTSGIAHRRWLIVRPN